MPRAAEHLEKVEVPSADALWRWLKAHHGQPESVWFVHYKKHVTDKYLPMDDLIEALLCWGWIDSLPRKLDADRTMTLCAPRRAGSAWSAVNKRKVARLIAQGRMQPPGQARIDSALADGSWTFLDDVDALIQPDDLRAALAAVPGAQAGFDAFPRSTRRGVLEWIKTAKKSDTRNARLDKTAQAAAQGKSPIG